MNTATVEIHQQTLDIATISTPSVSNKEGPNVLPADWQIMKLRQESDLISKGTTPTTLGKPFVEKGISFIKVESISNAGYIANERIAFIDEDTHILLRRSQLKNKDILFSIAGALGRVAIVDSSMLPANTNQALSFIRLKERSLIDHSYLVQFLRSDKIRTYIDAIYVQAAQANISLENVRDIEVVIPPILEQRAIASALSDVDSLIAALDKLIAKKRAIKQATMQQLLTGKTRLPGFSKDWQIKRLSEVSAIKTGNKNNDDKVGDGQYPFFVRSQTIERINSYSYDGEAVLIPGEGGIGSIIHYINGKFDYHQRVYKISDFDRLTCGKFIYYTMLHSFGKQAARGSVKATVDSLRLPTFLQFEYLAPLIAEQHSIATVLSDMDAEITALERRRDKTRAIKQGMMQELLTGRIRLVGPSAVNAKEEATP